LASQIATEHLDSAAIDVFVTQTVSGSSAFDAQISSFLDLYPTYARSLFSSVGYAEMSIWSDVMNAPATTEVSVSTVAMNATSANGEALTTTTSVTQSATSSAPPKKGGKGHPKNPKKHGTITSRAVLPMKTVKLPYPNYADWNAEQASQ
jgi:hypothetical protein